MKTLLFALLLFRFPLEALAHEHLYSPEVSPKEAWAYLLESPYEKLPHFDVSIAGFFSKFGENLLVEDSKRTVRSEDHFIPPQRKLLFPNGICVRGEWTMDQHSLPYTGYFKPGSRGVVIGRAAVSLDKIRYKDLRTLALSGKIFPTADPEDERRLGAANFLLMNDNAGKKRTWLTEAWLTNAAPRTVTFAALPLIKIALTVAKAFDKADVRRDVRQLYQIAELDAHAPYSSPKWLQLIGTHEQQEFSRKLRTQDFRDEVKGIIDQKKSLEFEVRVASDLMKGQPQYHKIGSLKFTEYVASPACDESLHFQHPPYREDYALPVVDQKRSSSK